MWYVHKFSRLLSMFRLKQRTTGSVKRKLMLLQVWNMMEQPTNQLLLYLFLTVLTNTHLPSSAQWHTPASGTSTANWYMKWSTADKTLQTGHVIARPNGCENNLANTHCGLASWPYTFVITEYVASYFLTILIENEPQKKDTPTCKAALLQQGDSIFPMSGLQSLQCRFWIK